MGRQSRKLQPAMSLFVAVVVNRCLFKNHASLQRRFVMATALVLIGKDSRDLCTCGLFLDLKRSTRKTERERERLIILLVRNTPFMGCSGGVRILLPAVP